MATKHYRRDFKALEQRRKQAARRLTNGMTQAEVARELGVSRQSVSVWARALALDQQAWQRKPVGSDPGLGRAQRRWLCQLLVRGAEASGFATEAWTLHRIAQLIEREFGIRYGRTNVWLLLKAMGFSCQRPTRVRTWAPRGCPPVLHYSFIRQQLTVITARGMRSFYFHCVPGAISKSDIVQFLRVLQRHAGRLPLVIWDGLPQHRGKVVSSYLRSTNCRIVAERLPGYAPGLNPSEYIWAYLKQHELANLCRDTIAEVKTGAARRLKSM